MTTRQIGDDMFHLITKLYPICRSITGDGVRQTLGLLQEKIPLQIHEVPSGTRVFDWTVPKEWTIHDAYVCNSKGEKVIDFKKSNLHLVSYSMPVNKQVSLQELKQHLFTIPEYPDWIPYRTSYYNEDWGFCISYNECKRLQDDQYHVCIDSSLDDGHLTYGEYFIQGENKQEVLISTHICHPSLCNDNLSGVALSTALGQSLHNIRLKYSYRFLFIPGTIGSITWLSKNEPHLENIQHGLVISGIGDSGGFTYKKTRDGGNYIDRIVQHVLKTSGYTHNIIDFFPYGYDERQYCSPGINLPVGLLSRTPYGQYPEYHTSADDLTFVRPENLSESYGICKRIFNILEKDTKYVNLFPKCEPQLGKRGLYAVFGGENKDTYHLAMLWILNLSDGNHSLLDIAERAELEFEVVAETADKLKTNGLLKAID